MKSSEVLEKLMSRNDKLGLVAVDNILRLAIPFNAPHAFRIKKLTSDEVQITLPNFKLNHNHLGGMHACAIATLGEYCAGMTLVKNFGMSRYRYILSELSVKYHLQGRTGLTGVAKLSQERVDQIKNDLTTQDKVLVEHNTEIMNKHGEKIADVKTIWQMKDWNKVQLK